MNKEYFIEKLEQKKEDKEKNKQHWNSRAKEFYTYSKENKNEKDLSVEYLKQFIDFKDKSVLDVGFGGGKHLKLFSDEGASLLCGVEISDQMMKYAKKYFTENGMDIEQMELYNIPWEEINLDKLNWRNKFDLVFVSKSPALDSYESIKKLIAASKKGVFFSTHIDIKEDVLSQVYKEINGRAFDSKKQSFWSLFNILYLDGYYPNVKVEDTKREVEYPMDILVSRYAHRIFSENPNEKDLNKLKELIKKHEVNGKVTINIERKNGFIYFEK